jgi:hypothetical protein
MKESKGQKTRRKALRELSGTAHERELTKALLELEKKFQKWRSGSISSFQLSDIIHEFHNGTNRDIWKRYSCLKPNMSVPAAIASGILKGEEVPPEILEDMKESIQFFREGIEDESGQQSDA